MTNILKQIDLTTGSINHHLFRMTIPMIWGILAIVSFQLVDAYYISLLGTAQMAAFSYTFPVTYGIFSIFIGFSIAVSSVISRLIGANDTDNVKRVTAHGIILIFITSIIIAIIGITLIDPLFRAMGADDASIPMIRSFMLTYLLGTFFVSMPIVGNAALRASGDAVLPAIIMTIAAIINALINPVLIFGLFGFPRMEMFGAAIGTVIANFGAMVAGLYLMYRKGLFDFSHFKNMSKFGDSTKRILVIALPAGITSMLPSFVNSSITKVLSNTTDNAQAAVAAFGAATRVESLTLVILMALSIGMAPIIGQNWGAGNIYRVRETIRSAIIFSVAWSFTMGVLLVFLAHPLAASFAHSNENEFYKYLYLYFLIVPFSYFIGNISQTWGSAFNAIGKPQYGATMLFIKSIIMMIPAVIIGANIGEVMGVFIAIAVVNVLSGVGIHLWARRKFYA